MSSRANISGCDIIHPGPGKQVARLILIWMMYKTIAYVKVSDHDYKTLSVLNLAFSIILPSVTLLFYSK